MVVSRARRCFDKSRAVDAASRYALETMIEAHIKNCRYTPEETSVISFGLANLEMFIVNTPTKLLMDSPLTEAQIVFNTGERHAYGRAMTSVRSR